MRKHLTKAEFLANSVYALLIEELFSFLEEQRATRLTNILKKKCRIKFVGEMAVVDKDYFRRTPRIGTKSLGDLKAVLKKVGIKYNILVDGQAPLSAEILRELGLLRSEIEKNFSPLEKLFSASADKPYKQWGQLAKQLVSRENIEAVPNPLHREILTARCLQENPVSLEELASRYGVSKEFIRDSETKGVLAIRRNVRAAMVTALLPK